MKTRMRMRSRKKVQNKTKKRGGNKNTCKYNSSATITKKNCGPLSENNFTCYTDNSLQDMKKYWNLRHPDCPIESTNTKDIWNKLKGFMGNVCDTESCWLKQKFMKSNVSEELLNYTFSPEAPDSWKTNPRTWLSSVDIEKVMIQYEVKHKNFKFIGPSPIDFDTKKMYGECVWDELCKLNLKKMLNKGVNMIGVIFNTDPHYLEGSHWISLFINIKNNTIYFFDSVGDPAPKEVTVLIERLKKQGTNMKRKITDENTDGIGHQKKNTECGIYSLYFIINMLEGKSFEKFKNINTLGDDDIFKYRSKFFN